MARAYSVSGPNATGSATKTLVSLVGGTSVRTRVFDLTLGSQATPADQAAMYAVTRWTTSAGTAGSSPTPNPVDPADVASTTTGAITHSGEPTYAATDFLDIPLNQRASFRWVASPGFELVNPATATTGIGLRLVAATASVIEWGSVFFFE